MTELGFEYHSACCDRRNSPKIGHEAEQIRFWLSGSTLNVQKKGLHAAHAVKKRNHLRRCFAYLLVPDTLWKHSLLLDELKVRLQGKRRTCIDLPHISSSKQEIHPTQPLWSLIYAAVPCGDAALQSKRGLF